MTIKEEFNYWDPNEEDELEREDLEAIYSNGYEALLDGQEKSECPYDIEDEELYNMWVLGWEDAERDLAKGDWV